MTPIPSLGQWMGFLGFWATTTVPTPVPALAKALVAAEGVAAGCSPPQVGGCPEVPCLLAQLPPASGVSMARPQSQEILTLAA